LTNENIYTNIINKEGKEVNMREKRDAVIVAYGRSAITRSEKGELKNIEPVDYSAQVINGVLNRISNLNPKDIDCAIVGCAAPMLKQGINVAKSILQRAELPDCIPAFTLSVMCCSGLQAIATGANAIKAGEADVIVAGGVESLTAVPFSSVNPQDLNRWLLKNRPGAYAPTVIGVGENIVKKYGITREEMDHVVLESHYKALCAQKNGDFDKEIIPVVTLNDQGEEISITKDDGIREGVSMEKLSTLIPIIEGGTITAAMASQVSDGAGFVVLMSREKAAQLDLKPIAKFVGSVLSAVEVEYTGDGPIRAIPKVLEKNELNIDQMDIIELNEAYASMVVSTIKELKLDESKVNPRGGAIALGHPLGATGANLTCKALSYLESSGGQYGLIAMCGAGGHGAAGIIEMERE